MKCLQIVKWPEVCNKYGTYEFFTFGLMKLTGLGVIIICHIGNINGLTIFELDVAVLGAEPVCLAILSFNFCADDFV